MKRTQLGSLLRPWKPNMQNIPSNLTPERRAELRRMFERWRDLTDPGWREREADLRAALAELNFADIELRILASMMDTPEEPK